MLEGGSMEYLALDRVPPDKVVGTAAHAVGELELSTRRGQPCTFRKAGT